MFTTMSGPTITHTALCLLMFSILSFTHTQANAQETPYNLTENGRPVTTDVSLRTTSGLISLTAGPVLKDDNYTEPHSNVSSAVVQAMWSLKLLNLYWNFEKFYWWISVIINPLIAVMGIVGNIISSKVIYLSGLNKPSNIFLLGLAVADICCLLGALNIPQILWLFPRNLPAQNIYGWHYSYEEAYICFIFWVAIKVVNAFGLYTSAFLCVAITIERLLAVYLPLHFVNIVTPSRAWSVCVCIFLFWVPYAFYGGFRWFIFQYAYDPYRNIVMGKAIFTFERVAVVLDLYVATVIGKYVPLAIVGLGSILIAIKVMLTRRKRSEMTGSSDNKKSSSSRTTTTLLTVCVVFIVTKLVGLPTYALLDQEDLYQRVLGNYVGVLVFMLDYINSSCNFVIYIVFNAKFRAILRELLLKKGRKK